MPSSCVVLSCCQPPAIFEARSQDMLRFNLCSLLLLCSNDVETNPGPLTPLARGPNLEKAVTDLKREIKEMSRVMERQDQQISSLKRVTDRFNLDNEVMTIKHEIDNLREKSSIQMAFSKRQKTDLSTAEFEINSLKKSVNQHKAELKHLGTVAINDLKNLKEETSLHLSLIKKEQSDNEDLRDQFQRLKDIFTKFTVDQRTDVDSLKKDFLTLREYNKVQVTSIKNVLESMMVEISKIKNEQTDFISKTENTLKILSGQTLRLSEESNMHKSFSNKSKQDFDKAVQTFGRRLEEFGIDSARTSLEFGKMTELQKSFVEDSKVRIKSLQENFDKIETLVTNVGTSSEKEFKDIKDNLSERKREINALQRKLESRANLMIEEFNQSMDEVKTDIDLLKTRISNEQNQVVSYLEGLISSESGRLTKVVTNCNERMEEIDHMYDDMQDRVFEIDKNRKNNLVFYGVKGDNTDPDDCERVIKSIMNTYMQVSREIPLAKVTRLWNGPSFRGFKPILVSFQLWKDKEEILRKNNLLQKSTNMYVTEDFSRKVRKHREELIKFAKSLRNAEPTARFFLQYDRLYVENEVFLYNEVEHKVERMLMSRNLDTSASLVTPRPGASSVLGGRVSRLRRGQGSRAGDTPGPDQPIRGQTHHTATNERPDTGVRGGELDYRDESLTETEAELIQSGHNIVLGEEDIIVRYDGPPEMVDDCASVFTPDMEEVDQFVDEEMRSMAESMSMAVFLSLEAQARETEKKEPRRRNSNLKEVNQLETVDEASREVSDESSRNTPMSCRTLEVGPVSTSSAPAPTTSRPSPSCDSDTEKMFPTEKVFSSN